MPAEHSLDGRIYDGYGKKNGSCREKGVGRDKGASLGNNLKKDATGGTLIESSEGGKALTEQDLSHDDGSIFRIEVP